jgi:hypothetical protein
MVQCAPIAFRAGPVGADSAPVSVGELPMSHSEIGAGPPSCAFSDCGSQWLYVSNEMERMAENGTATFADPDNYQAGIGDASVNLIVTAEEISMRA